MNGSIYFDNLQELAEFLKEFQGSTATFQVNKQGSGWQLKFLGGY